MAYLVTALICVPFLMALILFAMKSDKVRAAFLYVFAILTACTAVGTAAYWLITSGGQTVTLDLPGVEIWDKVILVGDFVLMGIVIWLSIKHKKGIICLLSIAQTALVAWTEIWGPEFTEVARIRMDWFTFIMILIIGVIGVAIGVYAVGYMRGYHVHHKEFADRRRFFFAMMFCFYGAMFGLVFSSSIIWMYFFWEITSVISFLLIGYTKTKEAETNSFRALWMNLLGGCGLAIAIWYAVVFQGTADLYVVIANAKEGGAALIPIAMLAFAALTKSAQFPFSGWLLGAMVAPTPSSALLHSATMVKAGVYLLVRISTAMSGNVVGLMVALVGGFTFLAASCLAISQSDGKKVLAYSTISNLGLIVACAGAGTKETIWAATFLIIFHAVSKSMLFQCVGAIENASHSRDVEDMQGLMTRFPKLAIILMIGICGMFLAPFGMLISKWAALSAFITSPAFFLVIFVAFGSATTMFYWTKWLTKILGASTKEGEHDVTQKNEYISMFGHALLVVALAAGFPLLSRFVLEPMLSLDVMFGEGAQVVSDTNLIVMVVMILGVFIVPVLSYAFTKKFNKKQVLGYMSGVNTGDNKHFVDSFGQPKELEAHNWYMEALFSEKKLFMPCVVIATVCIVVFLCLTVGGAF